MKPALALLAIIPCFAGQSIVLVNQGVQTPLPNRGHSTSARVEFYIHDWSIPTTSPFIDGEATGIAATLYAVAGRPTLVVFSPWNDGPGSTVDLDALFPTTKAAYVRIQRDVGNALFEIEIWDINGNRVYNRQTVLGSDVAGPYGGLYLQCGGPTVTCGIGFFRLHSTLIAMNSRPPVTADNTNTILHWKFDGNLNDASANAYPAAMMAGSDHYASTPLQNVVAKAKTGNAPGWADWVSLRAGMPNQLDGTASYSQADESAAVTYRWNEVASGERPKLIWDSTSSATPTITGAIFGTYTFQLTVTDANRASAATSLTVGAVATDDNGVVVNANPDVDKIFGPMIAYGKNLWGYMDERAMRGTVLRSGAYAKSGPPSWATAQAGTVDYIFSGRTALSGLGTALCAPVSGPSDATITVCDASKLDLTTFPTHIMIGQIYYPNEDVRICSATGNVLTVCYDGRGIMPAGGAYSTLGTGAQAWPTGTSVGQNKVTGTGTSFLSTLCPAGIGPVGAVAYNAGTVTMTRNSASVTGNGTAWSNQNSVVSAYGIRVAATHGGKPFVFYAYISAVNGQTGITMSRAYPSDADDGTFPYQIIAAGMRQPTLHYTRPSDSSDAQIVWNGTGCESDTALYVNQTWDNQRLNGVQQSRKQYSYAEQPSYVGPYGVNFYGEDLAHRALYYRSGWQPALDAANVMSDQYVTSPYLAGGDVGGLTLLYGGGAIGAFAAAVLDNRVSWSDLRAFAETGASQVNLGCNVDDTRDTAYQLAFLALAATFDPDPAKRATWLTALRAAYARDEKCKGTDNSWANGLYSSTTSFPPLKMTRGSAIATGTNLPPNMCLGFAKGTLSVTQNSAEASGTGFAAGNKVVITGTRGGAPFMGVYQYRVNSPTSITLAALWPGDSGTANYILEGPSLGSDGDALTTIGSGPDDPQLAHNWSCIWNQSGQITLNREWDGPSETAYLYKGTLAGFGQQPYMLGMKTIQIGYASLADPSLRGNWTTLAVNAAGWIHDVGFDPVTLGMHYGRVFEACEPATTPPSLPIFTARTPNCNFGLDPGSIRASRVLTAEASSALGIHYLTNPTLENRDWGDVAYGAIWGYTPYTNPGVYSDPLYVRDENSDAALAAYKWTGFFFGMGMAHRWPAERLGGVQPEAPVYVSLPLTFDSRAQRSGSARVTVTAPSGAKTDYSCSNSPCLVRVDRRQGAHWYQVSYVSGSGSVIGQDPPQLISAPALAPGAPSLTGPANKTTGVSLTPTLSWTAAANTTSYDVYLGTANPPLMLVGNTTRTSYTSTALIPGQYYWKVVARNSDGPKSSVVWSFTTLTGPGVATLYLPANASTNASLTPTLMWSAASGAASYDVYLGTTNPPALLANVATTSCNLSLKGGTVYYWKVVSKNGAGSTTSDVWSFTTLRPPTAFSLTAPADAATSVSVTPTLTWTEATGATYYEVYFGTVNPPPLITYSYSTSYSSFKLAAGTLYYWKIVGKNYYGSPSSDVWSFRTTAPPGAFTLIAPMATATGLSLTPTLSWTASAEATSYDVYLGTTNPPSTLVGSSNTTSYTAQKLEPGQYYWKVVAQNAAGSRSSPQGSFTTITQPAAVTLLSPANGSTNVSLPPVLSWSAVIGAASYDVYLGTTNPPALLTDATATSISPALNGGTVYYWKVLAKYEGGFSESSVWSFSSRAAR